MLPPPDLQLRWQLGEDLVDGQIGPRVVRNVEIGRARGRVEELARRTVDPLDELQPLGQHDRARNLTRQDQADTGHHRGISEHRAKDVADLLRPPSRAPPGEVIRIRLAVGVEVRPTGGHLGVGRCIVSLRLAELVVPDLVAPFDVELALWRQLVLEQLCQVHHVVVGRLVGDVDPGVFAGQVCQLDGVLPGAPRDRAVEPPLLRGCGGQGAVRPVHLGGLVGGRIVHEPQHLERLKAREKPTRERLRRRMSWSHQLHLLHAPLRPGE